MPETKSKINRFENITSPELSASILARRQAGISESGQPDPLVAYWEDPALIPFVEIGRQLLKKIDTEREASSLEQIIVDLTAATEIRGRERTGETDHPKGSDEERIIVLLLDRASESIQPKQNPAERTGHGVPVTLQPEIVINRSKFKAGEAGRP